MVYDISAVLAPQFHGYFVDVFDVDDVQLVVNLIDAANRETETGYRGTLGRSFLVEDCGLQETGLGGARHLLHDSTSQQLP